MNKGKIIVVEGTSNVGKTSLCKSCELCDQFVVIQEAIRYLENRIKLSQNEIMAIPNNIEVELLNQELLFDIEFEKLFDANIFCKKEKTVIIDKSIFAIMATAYAFEKYKNFKGAFRNSLVLYRKYMDKAKRFGLKLPDKYFLLSVNRKEFEKRNLQRNHILDGEWVDNMIIEKQNKALNSCMKFSSSTLHMIDTSGKTKEEVMSEFKASL